MHSKNLSLFLIPLLMWMWVDAPAQNQVRAVGDSIAITKVWTANDALFFPLGLVYRAELLQRIRSAGAIVAEFDATPKTAPAALCDCLYLIYMSFLL
jgi:hypothetical protein